jgi:NADH-quinone oxidoreductase subunit J
MAVEMVMIVGVKNFGPDKIDPPVIPDAGVSNTVALGRVLYTDYLLVFELASVVLLVAIVAAIALTLRERRESKSMNPADQVIVKKEDRMRIVKMDAVREPVAEQTDSKGDK